LLKGVKKIILRKMAKPEKQLRKVRLEKLEKIKKLGVNPYPAQSIKKQTNAQALKMLGKKVAVAGRIRGIRGHGAICFFDLQDASGKIQLVFRKDKLSSLENKLLALLDIGDFIDAQGKVAKTEAGEISVLVSSFHLLAKSLRPLPEKRKGLVDVETRLRKRYLDILVNPEISRMFVKKEVFWQTIREYLKEQGFLEVETPVLELVPGGADARPFVTHHHFLDLDLYLRISLELSLKRLIVGGYEKIFEIGRVFRNEGIDAEHLQDYTQMEFYWAYASWEELMDFVENLYKEVVKKVLDSKKSVRKGKEIDWFSKWPKIDFCQAFKKETKLDFYKNSKEDFFEKAKSLGLSPDKKVGKGRLADLIFKEVVRPKIIRPSFVTRLPVEISPLAKRDLKDKRLTQRILVVAGGTELGNGFSELNDPLDQEQRFKAQQALREKGDEEAQMYDKDFVEALEYGMPPTAGFGMSERFFSFLMDKPIRETVFFPLMRPKK